VAGPSVTICNYLAAIVWTHWEAANGTRLSCRKKVLFFLFSKRLWCARWWL